MAVFLKPALLTLIEADVTLKRVSSKNGGEYAGPCPFCGGTDRFRVWPHASEGGHYKCFGPAEGRAGCGRAGDAIQYLRDRNGLSYTAACQALGVEPKWQSRQRPEPRWMSGRSSTTSSLAEPLEPPTATWQAAAKQFVEESKEHLHTTIGEKALTWLQGRGLALATICHAGLGYNPTDHYQERTTWAIAPAQGQHGNSRSVWLPRGIVIPWSSHKEIWRVNIRRPVGDPKYVGPAGWKNALYIVDQLGTDPGESNHHQRPVVLVEGEFDALSVHQAAGDLVAAVATGSTSGARHLRWIARLALVPLVLIAYDADDPGEQAAAYWLDVLPNARRWRPFWQDTNAMMQDGVDLRAWIEVGLASARAGYTYSTRTKAEGENDGSRAA